MAAYVLDLNDIELRIFREQQVVAESSGYAYLHDGDVTFGDTARRQIRLHPRQASNQHWHRLAMDPLPIRGRNLANLADLVYRQLRELTRLAGIVDGDELLVAAPASVTPDQLGLFLGIAQELTLTVTGLVDAAVAAATTIALPAQAVHVDLSLHRATVTSLDIGDDVARVAAREVTEGGLTHIVDGWVNVVADRFVAETRFDPLRIAETEQQVYNQVHDWMLAGDSRSEFIVEASHRDTVRRVTVPPGAMMDKAISRFRSLSDALPAHSTVVLSHRAARVPGLRERLVADRLDLLTLAPDAVASGVAQNVERVRSNPAELRFVTRLPRIHAPRSAAPTGPVLRAPEPAAFSPRDNGPIAAAHDARWPTHVLYRGCARPIGTRLLLDSATFPDAPRGHQPMDRLALVERASDGVWVRTQGDARPLLNGVQISEPTRTRIGDVLRSGDHEFVLIRVIDGQET